MKNLVKSAFAVVTTLLVAAGLPAHAAERPIELLVKWREGPASLEAAEANARLGGVVVRNFNAIGWQQVRLPAGTSLTEALQAYRRLQSVVEVEPNASVEISLPLPPSETPPHEAGAQGSLPQTGPAATRRSWPGLHGPPAPVTPNDPMFGRQWHLRRIDAPTAWATTTGSTNVVVAIIDTGVDYTHPDLAPNMWYNPGETGVDPQGRDKATNGVDDDGNGYVDDVHGADVVNGTGDPMDKGFPGPDRVPVFHGTQMAGNIGAAGNNAQGVAGINWTASIMAVRLPGDIFQTASPKAYLGHFVAAWDYVLQMRRRGVNVRVVSNSYAFPFSSVALADAISTAGNEGILAVFAALNSGVDQDRFTTAFPNAFNLASVINVASSTESDTLLNDSNFGRSTVHLAAPGANIFSTIPGPGYQANSGTSQACPIVAGAAALLLSAHPTLTIDQLKAALLGSVDQPLALRQKVISNGRLNVARALASVVDPNPTAIVIRAAPAGQRTPANAPIEVTFSRPMNRTTVEAALTISPALEGEFVWEADGRTVTFRPATPWDRSTNYTVRIVGTAQDEGGGGLDGDFDGAREGAPADDFTWSFRFPKLNDDFANAQALSDAAGSVEDSNRYALLEAAETSHAGVSTIGQTVWYRWVEPSGGWGHGPGFEPWYTFDLTQGTTFDSMLAVYSGDSIDTLTAVAGNDDQGTARGSRVSFPADSGRAYSIVVASKSAFDATAAGNFRLRWYPTPPAGFTGSQFSPVRGMPGARVTLTGTNFTGTTAVLFGNGSAAFANALTNNLDLRITATVPPDATSGPITIVTPHGSVTSTTMFQVLPPPLAIRGTLQGQVEISWPATSAVFVLESASELAGPIWAPVSVPVLRADGQSRVLMPGADAARFFRLKAQ